MLADSMWARMMEMPQIAIIMGSLIPIVGLIANFWYRAHKVQSENQLKRTLVERGMSADEIERVIAARTEDADARR